MTKVMLEGYQIIDADSHVLEPDDMSDYPHTDHQTDISEKAVALQERLSRKTVQKLLWDKPARFYGLE